MLSVGVIGYGYWGPNVVRNLYSLDGCRIASVCDRQAAALARVRRTYPDLAVTQDPNDLLTSPKIDAIAIIRRAGGVPVLAHPGLANRDAMIPDLATAGLMGIEVHYAEHSAGQIERYLEMCRTLDLVATGGSDYHGPQSGRTNPPGTPNVPWSAWEQLQRVAEQARRGATPSLPRSQSRSASD